MNDISTPRIASRIANGAQYIESLRGRGLTVWLFGEKVEEPVDHPIIRPSINALARTYDLAVEHPELASVVSPFTGERVSRFLHVCTSAPDLVAQNKMQRRLGQLTGTCFQRCVGLDAIGASVEELPDGWRVSPGSPRGARIATQGDHRIAIAFAIAALVGVAGTVELDDPECVAVSYPTFWADAATVAS